MPSGSDAQAPGISPDKGWTHLIDQIVDGDWVNPETQQKVTVPYESIVFRESLDGSEAELVRSVALGSSFAVVSDQATYEVMGRRVAESIAELGRVKTIVLDHPHADLTTAEELKQKLEGVEGVIAVGSGTINDLCKYVTSLDGRRYCVFGTSGSMNGYTSTTASMTLASGLKVSLPAHAPRGFFVDLSVSANAPGYLAAAGFGDCLARSVAQIDWWMSHRLLGSAYWQSPYLMQDEDEKELNLRADKIPKGDVPSIAYLYRVLTLCGLGISVTGISNHGSMGEHQISHYIDCFAGGRHPKTLHGQQVGVASLSMARLQQLMLARDTPPKIRPTHIDFASMERRMGKAAEQCLNELRLKAFDEAKAEAMNIKLQELWPVLKKEVEPFMIPAGEMTRLLKAAGGPATPAELGVPLDFYREAILHCREMRNRFSFLDIAADADDQEAFAAALG